MFETTSITTPCPDPMVDIRMEIVDLAIRISKNGNHTMRLHECISFVENYVLNGKLPEKQ